MNKKTFFEVRKEEKEKFSFHCHLPHAPVPQRRVLEHPLRSHCRRVKALHGGVLHVGSYRLKT